jgi:hypothetical protein
MGDRTESTIITNFLRTQRAHQRNTEENADHQHPAHATSLPEKL